LRESTRWPTATTSHDLFHHIDSVLLRIPSTTPGTSCLLRLDVPHLLHHVHQVAHPSELLQQAGIYRLAHLLRELFRVALQRIEVVAHAADVHLAHLLDHVTEFMILLQKEDDFLGMRPGALGNAYNTCFIESFLYHIC
jgi:hypothetical protein